MTAGSNRGALSFRALPFWVLTGSALVVAALLNASTAVSEEAAIESNLDARYVDWLEMVDLMITEDEKTYFLSIAEDFRRDAFIERFWKERDPDPLTHMNELRRPWEEHAEIARRSYPTLLDGRAQVLMLKGEPYTFCLDRTREKEIWYYEIDEEEVFPITLFSNVQDAPYEIYDSFHVFYPTLRSKAVQGLTMRNMCGGIDPKLMIKEITRRLIGTFNYDDALQEFLAPPEDPSPEWVASFAAFTTDLPAGAETFETRFETAFPGYYQQRTVVEGIAVIPPGVAGSLDLMDGATHQFLLTGEIVRDGSLFDSFRYDFEVPATGGSAPIPLIFQRYLRPGPATLYLKIEDLFSRRFARVEHPMEVPRIETQADVPQLADTELMRLLAEANAAAARGERILRLVPPHRLVLTGLVRFKTFHAGDFHRVKFFLDGKPILNKKTPPYSVELDLGDTPIPHLLRVAGFDEDGTETAGDDLQLNPGGQRFRVRLAEPRSSQKYRQSVPTVVDVQTPDGKPVERVELFVDENRVATLFQEPFAQPVLLPEEQAMVYVRAVAYLEDGNSTEDVVFINAPDYLEEIDVQMVEVYATVHDRRGRPVLGLEEPAFAVSEDGQPQNLRRFEWVSDLPIHAGLLLDVSASMEGSLETVTGAALEFVGSTIQERDRVALLTFNERPDVVQRFTNDVAAVQNSLATLRSEGGTAIFDSLVFALHYFHGIRGQKALLLLSDGQDESSGFAFEDTLEYARRAAVTVYAIGLGEAAGKRAHRKVLNKIAGETGGRAFFLQDASELEAIYATIQEELRSQYLLVYQSNSSQDPSVFRRIEVKVDGGHEVRAMSGYYP
ncbi:MAG: VWA domain-containing protein [bacterium]|nr:VWA domain-containing protein [bacterium]